MNDSTKKIYLGTFLGILFFIALAFALPFTYSFIAKVGEALLHRPLRRPDKWIGIVSKTSAVAAFFILLSAFNSFTTIGKSIFSQFKSEVKDFFAGFKQKKMLAAFVFVVLFYLFAFYKVINADFFYCDDIIRNITGKKSWAGFSRFISQYLSMVLYTNEKLQDIAPLTFFFSIAIMSVATVLLDWILSKKNVSILGVTVLSISFISPFFLQNFSFRFDCPYMTLAVLFPIVPFLFVGETKSYILNSVVFLILTCISYQSALGVYIVITIYFVLKRIFNNEDFKQTLKFIAYSIASFVIAMLLFKLFFMVEQNFDNTDYFSAKINLGAIFKNSAEYLKRTATFFGGIWIKIFFLISAVVSAIFFTVKSKSNKIISLCLFVIGVAAAWVLSFGPYLAMERPLLSFRAFIGFNVFVALICYSILEMARSRETSKLHILLVPVYCLVYGCVILLYSYGSALSQQKEYQTLRTSLLISDLNELSSKDEPIKFSLEGSIGYSEGCKVALKNYPCLKETLLVIPSSGLNWNEDILETFKFYAEDLHLKENPGYPLLKSTYYHDIYGSRNNFYIVLK